MTEKYNMPDERGHFGPYGGIFVAETLIAHSGIKCSLPPVFKRS
jgi:hypothetical protein